MKTILAAAAALSVAGLAGSAVAADAGGRGRGPDREPDRGPSITLYELPNYQGQARSFSSGMDNLADQGFNDRAQSARVVGRWRVCEDARLRGRCVEVAGDIANLGDLRMTVAISSFEEINRAGGGFGGGPGAGFGGQGPRPGGGFDRDPAGRDGPGGPGGPGGGFGRFAGESLDGRGASFFPRPQPGPYRGADDFCRRLGFSGVIYADDRGQALRDVVCRR